MSPQLTEGTNVLTKGEVGITIAAGGGGYDARNATTGEHGGAGVFGGELRARAGIGEHQELGVSAFGGASPADNASSTSWGFGGKLSYKIAPRPWLAIVAGAGGFAFGIATPVFGGDLAMIVAPYTDRKGSQVYVGARGSFVVPWFGDSRGYTSLLTVPVGIAGVLGKGVRIFFEVGVGAGFTYFDNEPARLPIWYTSPLLSVYGAAAVQYAFPAWAP